MENIAPKKRGRRPLGDRPLTAAEKKARYRAGLREKGETRVFEITLAGDTRAKVEEIASILRIPVARAVRLCADAGVGDMWLTALQLRDRMKRDAAERRVHRTISEISQLLERAGVDTIDIQRAVLGLKTKVEQAGLDALITEEELDASLKDLGSVEAVEAALKEMQIDDGAEGGGKAG